MKYFKNVNSYNELKKVYRELLKANHPDNGGDVEVMQAINVEYEALFPIWKNRQEKESGEIINETAAETRRKFYTQFGWEGSRYDCDLSLKEIAKIVRAYVKEKYPTYKFSVRTHYASMCQELAVVLKESPIEIYKVAEEVSEEEELAFIKKAERNGLWNLTSWTREVFEVCETPETCQFYLDCVEFSATKNYITDCELLTLRRVGRQKLKKLKGENSYYKKEPEDFAKKYYEINEENARLAQELNRFSKYETGSATRIYHEKCDFAYSILDKILDEHPEQAESTAQKIDYYCKKLAEYYNDYYRNEASCPSVLICGPANFPSKKKERQNERRTLLIERWNYLENYLSKIQNFFNVSRPIKSGDPDAIEQLEKKITELESEHKLHLSANKYYKKHKTLQGFEGLTSAEISQIESLIRDPSRFVPFYVSNETANLRRYKSRLERLKKEKNLVGTCESVTIPYQGVVFKMVENTENMRLQLFFEGKPSEEIRALLKSHSFRWSGKNKCWQRQLTNNARFSYKRLKEELKNLDGIKTAAV